MPMAMIWRTNQIPLFLPPVGPVAHPDSYRENRASRLKVGKVSSLNPGGITAKLIYINIGPVAQLNRAFDYGSKGFRFES